MAKLSVCRARRPPAACLQLDVMQALVLMPPPRAVLGRASPWTGQRRACAAACAQQCPRRLAQQQRSTSTRPSPQRRHHRFLLSGQPRCAAAVAALVAAWLRRRGGTEAMAGAALVLRAAAQLLGIRRRQPPRCRSASPWCPRSQRPRRWPPSRSRRDKAAVTWATPTEAASPVPSVAALRTPRSTIRPSQPRPPRPCSSS
mmetsp:Transcript_76820/g.197839  ORF Transcript_76820/g.197839 Transcript_76820/m.197839 type:complete len:201 (+) Transcript_76820:403-1005(+)